MARKGLSCFVRCWIGIALFYFCQDVYGVKVLDVTILSESNNTYLLREEKATMTCNFEIDNETESLKSVRWSKKNGEEKEFYLWEKGKRPVSYGVFKGRISLRGAPRKLGITSAHIDMHGDIKCQVTTTKGTDSKEKKLVVISDSCHESDWKFNVDEEECTETVQFKCVGFYPKPTPSCGLYDRVRQKFITVILFDQNVKRDNTHDLSVTRKFNVSEVIDYEDPVFLCDIIVSGADYKFRVQKEIFGERGCPGNYPQGNEMLNSTKIKETCWKQPANGSVITYQCDSDKTTKMITCVDGNWIDESDAVISDDSYCSASPGLHEMKFAFLVLLNAAIMFFMW